MHIHSHTAWAKQTTSSQKFLTNNVSSGGDYYEWQIARGLGLFATGERRIRTSSSGKLLSIIARYSSIGRWKEQLSDPSNSAS